MSEQEKWFQDRVAIVTGSGGGIGQVVAESLAQRGAAVVVSDLFAEGMQQTCSMVEAAGGQAISVQADVSKADEANALVEAALERFGRVDLLVNNAGITRDGLLMRMKDDQWEDVIRVNLTGTFNCTRAVMKPMMKQKYGRIVSLASVVGVRGNAGQVNYSASKAGIIGLTKSVARETASRGITVNAVAPGFIVTKMTDALNDKQRDAARADIPLGELGTPQDVANAIAFLASDQAKYITGQVLCVDGGMAM